MVGLALAGGAFGLFGLAGCDSQKSKFLYNGPTVSPGEVTIASTIHYPPFIADIDGSTPEGLGVDVCESVGADLGLSVEAITCDTREHVYQLLRERKTDLGGIVTSSDDRRMIPGDFAVSSDIMPCNFAIVAKGGTIYESLDDIDVPGTVIEASNHPSVKSFSQAVIKEAEVEYVENCTNLLNAVRNGQIPYCLMDQSEALYYLNTIYTNLDVALTIHSGANYVFIALTSSEDLLHAVDESLTTMKDSGMIESFETRWLGQPLRD